MSTFIYQKQDWPKFRWDNEHLITLLGEVRNKQGKIIGSMEALGFDLKSDASLQNLTLDILKTTEIEGEILNPEQVRSSLARRLGIDTVELVPSDRNVDGVVDMLLDAVQRHETPLTEERLINWHFSLFPTGRNGIYKINVGKYRTDANGPLQVVSGAMGRELVHFQAPSAEKIKEEMSQFIDWLNLEKNLDPVLKAAIAHLWFITIHPFNDGNGRIARAITDMLLKRADKVPQKYYSMSTQIQKERKEYYAILEASQKGTLDITAWIEWFLKELKNTLNASEEILSKVMYKHKFWNTYQQLTLNSRQILMLNKLLDDFRGKLTSSKWAKITKCSRDTALRDIQDLVSKNILLKETAGGRSTNYELTNLADF